MKKEVREILSHIESDEEAQSYRDLMGNLTDEEFIHAMKDAKEKRASLKCKICGKPIKESSFESFFTLEALENMPCSEECKQKQIAEQQKNLNEEQKLHPEWHGPINQSEPY
jgi:hypothetical protein